MAKKHFTTDWVTHNIPRWERDLVPRFFDRPTKALEIGSFEGRSACWFLDNLLTHDDSVLVCIDSWADGSPEFHCGSVVGERFKKNVKPYGNKCLAIVGDSVEAMSMLIGTGKSESFDLIYVDGGHFAQECLTDMCMAFRLLKKGGIMVVDDYQWQSNKTPHPPKEGVDAFLSVFRYKISLVCAEYQVILEKTC